MKHLSEIEARHELERERDVMAAALSAVLPGMGHLYKGHVGAAIGILLLGAPISIWAGVMLSLATLGLGLIVPIGFWAMTAVCAYFLEDRRARHPLNVL